MPPGEKRTPNILLSFSAFHAGLGSRELWPEVQKVWKTGRAVTSLSPPSTGLGAPDPAVLECWIAVSAYPPGAGAPHAAHSVLLPLGGLSTLHVDSHVELPTYFSLQLLCFAQHMFYLFLLVLLTPSSNQSKQGAPLSVEDAWHS